MFKTLREGFFCRFLLFFGIVYIGVELVGVTPNLVSPVRERNCNHNHNNCYAHSVKVNLKFNSSNRKARKPSTMKPSIMQYYASSYTVPHMDYR